MKSGTNRNDVDAMNNQHLIDNAIFDTTYAEPGVTDNLCSQVDEFIKNNLMPVIEEVFDQVDKKFSAPGSIMRLDNLEIDLGEIALSEYRQQMPAKLSQNLQQALDDMRFAAGDASSASVFLDGKSTAQAQLFYFLRHGYLPWYARIDAAASPDTLDTLLLESIDQSPDFLIEFMHANAGHDVVLQRLVNQFTPQCLQRVMRLLSTARGSAARQALFRLESMLGADDSVKYSSSEPLSPATSDRDAQSDRAERIDRGEQIDSLHRQLVAALLSQGAGHIESVWSLLFADHGRLLQQTLRYYGQQAQVRSQIVATFTATMRTELLRLLEPDEHRWLQQLLDHVEIFQPQADDTENDRKPRKNELWEFSLGYLLVERDRQFDKKAYVLSLLRQIAVSSQVSQALLLARLRRNISAISDAGKSENWLQRLASLVGTLESFDSGEAFATTVRSEPTEVPGQVRDWHAMESSLAQSYRRYERVKSTLTINAGLHRGIEAELINDIKRLQGETPWLLQRLYRELQTGSYDWSAASAEWSPNELAELCYALLSLNNQSDRVPPYGSATELVMAIKHKATESTNRQSLFADILGRLIKGELIDLEERSACADRQCQHRPPARTCRYGRTRAHTDAALRRTLDHCRLPCSNRAFGGATRCH